MWKNDPFRKGLTYSGMMGPGGYAADYLYGINWSKKLSSFKAAPSKVAYLTDANSRGFAQSGSAPASGSPIKRHNGRNSLNLLWLDGHTSSAKGSVEPVVSYIDYYIRWAFYTDDNSGRTRRK